MLKLRGHTWMEGWREGWVDGWHLILHYDGTMTVVLI